MGRPIQSGGLGTHGWICDARRRGGVYARPHPRAYRLCFDTPGEVGDPSYVARIMPPLAVGRTLLESAWGHSRDFAALCACPICHQERREKRPQKFRAGNESPSMSAMHSTSINLLMRQTFARCHSRPRSKNRPYSIISSAVANFLPLWRKRNIGQAFGVIG
jgi:hypothetical protein